MERPLRSARRRALTANRRTRRRHVSFDELVLAALALVLVILALHAAWGGLLAPPRRRPRP